MKAKTHSGAKKRLRVSSRYKMKRKQQGKRHILVNKSSKRKRHLGDTAFVSDADLPNIRRCFHL